MILIDLSALILNLIIGVESANFLHYKITTFAFVINKQFGSDTLKLWKYLFFLKSNSLSIP